MLGKTRQLSLAAVLGVQHVNQPEADDSFFLKLGSFWKLSLQGQLKANYRSCFLVVFFFVVLKNCFQDGLKHIFY